MKKIISFAALATACLFMLFAAGCDINIGLDEVDGNGNKQTRTYDLSENTAAGLQIEDLITIGIGTGKVSVSLSKDGKTELKISSDENVLDGLAVDTTGGDIRIKGKRGVNYDTDGISIEITGVTFEDSEFLLSGNTEIKSDECIKGDFELTVNGAMDGTLSMDAGTAKAVFNGSTSLDFKGKADGLNITMNGAGSCDSTELAAKEARVIINGAGSAKVYAQDTLNISINGAGSVSYKGTPAVSQTINGLGSVNRIED